MARRSPMTRLAAALALGVALLLPAAPAGAAIEVPDPEYAGAVFVSGPAGLVLLDEMEGGVRVGIALSDLPRGTVRLVAATARCGEVGGSALSLGLFHHIHGRFAAVWLTGRVDSVAEVGSLQLVARGARIACANTIHGDETPGVCLAGRVPCYGTMIVPEQLDGKVVRGILVRVTQVGDGPTRIIVARASPRVRAMLLGDAPCSEGGGEPILRMGFPIGVGVTVRWPELPEIGRIGSFWLQETNGTTTCLDAEHQALVWRS